MTRAAAPFVAFAVLALTSGCGARVGSGSSAPADGGASTSDGSAGDAGSGTGASPSGDGGPSCEAVGGQCLIGDEICAVPGSQYCAGSESPAGIYCCLSQVSDCGQPAATSYSAPCDAGATSTSSCSGPPPTPPPFTPGDAGTGGTFPSGCTVTFPYCNAGTPIACTCTGANWSCVY